MEFIKNLIAIRESPNNKLDPLVTEGFTNEEVKNLNFIYNRISTYRTAGFVTGISFSYLSFYQYLTPARKKRNPLYLVSGFVSFPLIHFLFNYLGFYNRKGSNTYLANLYSNNVWRINSLNFTNNYFVFNRKFTEEEKAQFLFNAKRLVRGPKKYHYNPHIHGSNE